MSNFTNSSIFNSFTEDMRNDDENIPKRNVFSGPGNEYFSPSVQKAIDLLMIGTLLFLGVLVTGCCVHVFFVCKSRKQKRLVVPSPEGIMEAAIVNRETLETSSTAVFTLETIQEATPEEDTNIQDESSTG
jgi:hypothetical protein